MQIRYALAITENNNKYLVFWHQNFKLGFYEQLH
jgi:hypothetical protein